MLDVITATILSDDAFKLLIAALCGATFGLERELSGKDPSIRTFALIALGSCLFSLVSREATGEGLHGDSGRIAAQVVTGIGFIGAGVIFREKQRVRGLTTAALVWVTAGIGMMIGFNRIDLAITASIIGLFVIVGIRVLLPLIELLPGHPRTKNQESEGGIE